MRPLRRYVDRLDGTQLRRILSGDLPPSSLDTGLEADLETLDRAIAGLTDDPADAIGSTTDAVLAPVAHRVFRHVPRRILLDMTFWHWLTCEQYSDYVLRRWASQVDLDVDPTLTSGQQERFLGSQSLVGVSRNALARLYWCASALHDDVDGYALVERMLSNQDLFTGVFEREFGLVGNVARACAEVLPDLREEERRSALRRLNLEAGTADLEYLTTEQVRRLLGV